ITVGERRASKEYAAWVMDIHKRTTTLPSTEVIAALGRALAAHPELVPDLDALIQEVASPEKTFSEEDSRSLAALEALRISVSAGGEAPGKSPSGRGRAAIS